MQEPAAGSPSASVRPRRAGQSAALIVATMVLALFWPLGWMHAHGNVTSLLDIGTQGPSYQLIHHDLPDAVVFHNTGHDGQQYYALARRPFDFLRTAASLDQPSYRYRRILFPLVAGAIAPSGGEPLIYAFLGLSLLGVGLGAWALTQLDGAPWWLPLTFAVNLGVAVSLFLSLGDALAAGLALAAYACWRRDRRVAALILITLAGLTREGALLLVVALAFDRDRPRRSRVTIVAAPIAICAAWFAFSAHAVHGKLLDGGGGNFGVPIAGWFAPAMAGTGRLDSVGIAVLDLWGFVRSKGREPSLRVFLGLSLLMLAVLGPAVMWSWENVARVAAPALSLALWAAFRTDDPSTAPHPARNPGEAESPAMGDLPVSGLVPTRR